MSLFDKIFRPQTKITNATTLFKALTAYNPVFTSWGGALYESELVRAAIDAKARHISKLKVDFNGAALPELRTLMRKAPNEFQTWSQFLYRTATILEVQNTVFILPVIDGQNNLRGYFPVLPTMCQLVESRDGKLWLRYQFSSGDIGAVEYDRCGILTKHQYKDDFMGDKNTALTPTMELMHIQQQAIKEGVKSAATFRFMAREGNFKDPEDIAKEQSNFTARNMRSDKGGFLLFPNTYTDIKQIDSKPFVLSSEQQKVIQDNVFNYFGVNEKVMRNEAGGDSLDAFFDGAIEPFAIQLSEVMTRMTYSQFEQGNGNYVYVNANRLQYMRTSDKISFIEKLGDRGFITINEGRELLNYAPLPDEEGNRLPIRGEYYFVGDEPNKEGGNDE